MNIDRWENFTTETATTIANNDNKKGILHRVTFAKGIGITIYNGIYKTIIVKSHVYIYQHTHMIQTFSVVVIAGIE